MSKINLEDFEVLFELSLYPMPFGPHDLAVLKRVRQKTLPCLIESTERHLLKLPGIRTEQILTLVLHTLFLGEDQKWDY